MIPHSRVAAVVAGFLAVGAHAGGLTGFASQDVVRIEGGGDAEEAALGASFADMTTGTIEPSIAREAELTPVAEIEHTPPEPMEPLVQAKSAKPVEMAKPVEVAEPIEAVKPVETSPSVAQKPLDQPAVVPFSAQTLSKDEPVRPVEIATANPSAAEIQSKPTEHIETLKPDQNVSSVDGRRAAIRPMGRPERRKPVQKKAKTKQSQPKPSVAAKAGNGNQNAKKGTEAGTKPKGSANARRSASASSAAGHAAASNYPGLVRRKIHRARRKSVNVRGSARVSFRISDSGALAGVSISRSSGSNRLDQVALAQVRAAAPFPKPPAGARRQFSVEIKGK
ncbi:Gram-negative bacterial tonB protein [Falsiruegeria litorea R37]|uniref:Gram-negative bacterial tonB protein n=1 Tax=Falsiruegeria litorea R37 TaxID=1200284 RepID=A0A1Y5SR46_9RHOB|nr:energy transducer TonB [Falsiruegeria litorea]SLN46357.1 Gram-negative bacterial tonB protein [Falsiruegeria litorea R37]